MSIPHVVVIERSDTRYALDELPERLSLPPRSTPELDKFRSLIDDDFVAEVFVAGDAVLGINATRELFAGSVGSSLREIALPLNLCVAVPEFRSMVTRGFETEEYQMFCSGPFDYASPQMIDERVRFLDNRGRAEACRRIFDKFELSLNHPANGEFLPNTNAAGDVRVGHHGNGLHSNREYEAIYKYISKAKSQDDLIKRLGDIRNVHQNGSSWFKHVGN